MNYIEKAKALKNRGISVIPLKLDGSKLPKIKWTKYQTQLMSDAEIEEHFEECGGVAALTGNISNLYVLDFDLKYQHESQDFWKAFMEKVPKEMRKRFLVNRTRNNGFHVWIRTTFQDKSRKLTRRASTIPELGLRYDELIAKGIEPLVASQNILKAPFEVVIETRSRGSYAVFFHTDYQRFYGTKLHKFTEEEVEIINEIAYSLDYNFVQKQVFAGTASNFSTVRKYNDDATAQTTLALVEATGMFTYVDTERNGNLRVLRTGSKSEYSGRIYAESGVLHLFTENSIFSTLNKTSFSPFEVYTVCKNLTNKQAVKELTKSK